MAFDSVFESGIESGDVFNFKSISLPLVADFLSLERDDKPVVLDFSPANQEIVQFVAQHRCVYISSSTLMASLVPFAGQNTEESVLALDHYFTTSRNALEKYENGKPIGAILVWDLFHYLSRENIISIMAHLSPMCMKGACLSAFVWQTDKIPKIPGSFRIVDPNQVEYQINTIETIQPQVLLAAQSIVNMMPSFIPIRMLASPSGIFEITLEFNELVDPPDPRVISTDQLTGHYR